MQGFFYTLKFYILRTFENMEIATSVKWIDLLYLLKECSQLPGGVAHL